MELNLQESVVFVTGGSSGIGLATVDALLAEGARVATCARDASRLEEVAAARPTAAGQLLTAPCDVRDAAQVTAFVGRVIDAFGGIDGLVNNAGQSRMKAYEEVTWDDWRDELDLKFSSVLNPLNASLEQLRASPNAAVVNVNAVLARQPETNLVTTSAARAGILNLSKNLSNDLAGDGIRVNSVCLGIIDTGQWRRRYDDAGSDQTWEDWTADLARSRGVPLERFGTAEEVAAAIVFLLSSASSYITGAALDVSGGVGRYV